MADSERAVVALIWSSSGCSCGRPRRSGTFFVVKRGAKEMPSVPAPIKAVLGGEAALRSAHDLAVDAKFGGRT